MTMNVADVRTALLERVPAAARDPASVRLVRSPGRINLIGEHTDYNEGFVLPMAIDREIVIAFVPTDDRRVEITRLDTGAVARLDLDGNRPRSGTWVDYLSGMASVLAGRGVPVRGLRGVIASSLPIAVGLSSSAAIETAAAWALADGDGPPLAPLDLARAGQQVEHEFIGVNSGLMDQLAVILGRRDAALLIDCRSLEHRGVPLPLDRHAVLAVDSGSPRRLGSSAYNERRAECEAVVS
ncbi:MAG: galactokinase, partial [Candidatus Limnocylindria bacterium]